MIHVVITKFLIMKRYLILNAICLMVLSVNAHTPASNLIKRLKALEKIGVMIGHQDDPV